MRHTVDEHPTAEVDVVSSRLPPCSARHSLALEAPHQVTSISTERRKPAIAPCLCNALLERLAAVLDRIARQPAGELYREEMLRTSADGQVGFACTALRASRAKLLCAQPICSFCPNCRPTHPDRPYPSCKTCGGRGWTTRPRYEACGQAERQKLLKMAAGGFAEP